MTGTSSRHSVPVTDGPALACHTIGDEIRLHLDLWEGSGRGGANNVIVPRSYSTGCVLKWKCNTDKWSSPLIVHSGCTLPSPDVRALIHLRAAGQPSVPSRLRDDRIECQPQCQNMRGGSSSCQCLQRRVYAGVCLLLNKALYGKCEQSQESAGVPLRAPSISGERSKTERELLCEETWRIKRNDAERGWCRRGIEGGEGRGFPWGEKLSVPGRLQTLCSPVISPAP